MSLKDKLEEKKEAETERVEVFSPKLGEYIALPSEKEYHDIQRLNIASAPFNWY